MPPKVVNSNARNILALNIRRLRGDRGISQEELADLAGLHRTYVGSIERSERNVSIDNIAKLATALRVDISDLMKGATSMILLLSDGDNH